MMSSWRVFITPTAERSLKKLPSEVKDFVLNEFPPLIAKDPLMGESLHGPLSWLRSYRMSVSGLPYRIAYELKQKEKYIWIQYVDYRGKFYEKLRRLFHV